MIETMLDENQKKFRNEMMHNLVGPIQRRLTKTDLQRISLMCDKAADEWRAEAEFRIDNLVDKHEVETKLQFLDELAADQKARDPKREAWRPSGIPKVDMKAYDDLRTLKYRDHLKCHVQSMSEEVDEGKAEVIRGRTEVAETDKILAAMSKEQKEKIKKAKIDKNGQPKKTNEELKELCDRFKEMMDKEEEWFVDTRKCASVITRNYTNVWVEIWWIIIYRLFDIYMNMCIDFW